MSESQEHAGWTHVYSGKVRDLYVPTKLLVDDDSWTGDPLTYSPIVLVVATDRVSAYDQVLSPAIPGKGAMLTSLTRWWFDQLPQVPNHLAHPLDDRLEALGLPEVPAEFAERGTLCRTLDMFPVECVVRGFITGGGWKEYQETGAIGGYALPEGLQNGDRLPEPIYTPAWKAPSASTTSTSRTSAPSSSSARSSPSSCVRCRSRSSPARRRSPKRAASSSPTRSSSSAPTGRPAS